MKSVVFYDIFSGSCKAGTSDMKLVDGMYMKVSGELYTAATVFLMPDEKDLLDKMILNRNAKKEFEDKNSKEMYEILNEKSRRRMKV